jgi:hypothetical protein
VVSAYVGSVRDRAGEFGQVFTVKGGAAIVGNSAAFIGRIKIAPDHSRLSISRDKDSASGSMISNSCDYPPATGIAEAVRK